MCYIHHTVDRSSCRQTFTDIRVTYLVTGNPRPRCPLVKPLESVLPALPAVETTEKLHLQLHLKPLIRYHKHLYRDSVTSEPQTDGTREACHIDI